MSAFCVFGVSRQDCRRKAERKVKKWDEKTKKMLTLDEYNAQVNTLAEELFVASTNAIQISPTFDAPQFCRDWLDVAERGGISRRPACACVT